MSNALPILLAAGEATTRPEFAGIEDLSTFMTTLCGIGICVLLIWAGHAVVNPTKLKLIGSPGRRNNLTFFHVIGLFITALFLSATIASLAAQGGIDNDLVTIIGGLAFPFLLGCGLFVAAPCFHNGAVSGMGFTARRWLNDSIRSVVTLLAVLPLCVALLIAAQQIIQLLNPDLMSSHAFLKILTDPDTPAVWSTLVIFAALAAAPIGEEIFFRGVLQSTLRSRLGRPWLAIIVASFLFAAMHMAVLESLPALFVLAIALGYSYERTGRLWAPITIHMLFNLVMVIDAMCSPS